MSNVVDKKCGECGITIIGRTDKKFCSDQCRNTFNNRLNSEKTVLMRTTNHVLRKNRRILLEFHQRGIAQIRRDALLASGFNFNLFTSCTKTKAGHEFFYCYEQGYIRLKKGFFRLVIKKDVLP
jgi:predicted nucleic acid-binding Zn ribbon protein